jgi:arylsulfatase A-like enzyme
VIIFLSDQGLGWGEHRWLDKRCPYAECIRIPLLIRYAGITSPGTAEDRFALNIDLAPTILDFAGVAVPPGVEGTSLVPLLDGSAGNWRTDFLIEQWQGNSRITSYTGLHNEAWTYVEYTTGEVELYELTADPYELVNVATNPAYSQVVATLANRLDELLSPVEPTATPITNTATPTPIPLTQTPTPTPTGLTVTNTPIPPPTSRPSGTPMPTRQITPRPTLTATPSH